MKKASKSFKIIFVRNKTFQNMDIEDAPIEWADKHPLIDDFNGIWSDRSITLDDIRTKGWKRN